MKKNCFKSMLMALPLLASLGSTAQINKGTAFLGGILNFSTYSYEQSRFGDRSEYSGYNVGISPRAGVYLCPSFALGVGLHYGVAGSKNSSLFNNSYSETKQTQYTFGGSVFGRYNWSLSRKFGFFIDGNFSYMRTNQDVNSYGGGVLVFPVTPNNDFLAPGNTYSMVVVPGLIFFPSQRIGIEATYGSLRYQHSSADNNSPFTTNKSSNLGLNLGLSSIQFGFNYYFGCNKPKVKTDDMDNE